MYWKGAFATAVAWGVLGPIATNNVPISTAFTPPAVNHVGVKHQQHQSHQNAAFWRLRSSTSGSGWDNENFLEALSQGPDAINKANDEYRAQSRFGDGPLPSPFGPEYDDVPRSAAPGAGPGGADGDDIGATKDAVLTDEMKQQIKEANEIDQSQGGSMFKEMMSRAQQGETIPRPPPTPPAAAAPAAPAAGGGGGTNFDNLSVEQQAELFRQMMSGQQPPQQQAPPQPPQDKPNYLPPGTTPDGRRVGRNRDADAIANTSDVYFAQLKRDSTVRNLARYRGEEEKANEVFTDPSIKDIKLQINPFLEEQKQKERDMLETSPDEMLIPLLDTRQDHDIQSSGISYKEKLAEQKRQRQQQQQNQNQPISSDSTITGQGKQQQQQQQQQPQPQPPQENKQTIKEKIEKIVTTSSTTPTPTTKPPPPPQQPQQQQQSPPRQPSRTTVTTTAPTTTGSSNIPSSSTSTSTAITVNDKDPEEMRRDLRTLMGLLIKHRGGEGFGSGRLYGAEADRFINLAKETVAVMKHEALISRTTASDSVSSASDSTASTSFSSTTSVSLSSPPEEATPAVPSPPPAPTQQQQMGAAGGDRIGGLISCIEGAVLMYRNSPPELRDSVLVTLRAAMISAANTLNEDPSLGTTEVPSPEMTASQGPSGAVGTPTPERVDGLISVIEGAIQMYKNSPTDLQPAVLFTLRASLVTGVGTLNEIITNQQQNEVSSNQSEKSSYSAAVASMPAPATAPPAAPVVAAPVQAPAASGAATGNDENSVFFKQVYAKLEKAKGNGKMGLSTNLSADEAYDLADDIAKMRSLLVEELETGIPPSSSDADSPAASAHSSSSSSSSSKYQEMLAKARAEKEDKK